MAERRSSGARKTFSLFVNQQSKEGSYVERNDDVKILTTTLPLGHVQSSDLPLMPALTGAARQVDAKNFAPTDSCERR
jgi:hypothetical protein